MYFEWNNTSSRIHCSIGVSCAYVQRFTFLMNIFGYFCRASMIGSDVLFKYPTGEANSTNISQFGFVFAADSIAHACLIWMWNCFILDLTFHWIVEQFNCHHQSQPPKLYYDNIYLALSRIIPFEQEVSWKNIVLPNCGLRSSSITSDNETRPSSR